MNAARRLAALTLLSLPVLYLGIILSVICHEAAGHGLAAVILGGRFNGFGIAPDGFGWAAVDAGALSAPRRIAVLAAGAGSTVLMTAVFFILGAVLRKKPLISYVLTLLGMTFAGDGLPYVFWDAVFLSGVGDFSMIWLHVPSAALRISAAAASGALMAGAIVWANLRYARIARDWAGGLSAAACLILLALQGAAWFLFDWDQLVPGVGLLPGITGCAIALVTLGAAWVRDRRRSRQSACLG